MKPEKIFSFINEIRQEGIMLSYYGKLDEDLITFLLQFAEMKCSEFQTPPKIRKKIVNILVESMQNLFHYGKSLPEEAHEIQSLLMIGRNPEGYTIVTGNAVTAEEMAQLRERLEKIEKMSEEELTNTYRKTLIGKDEHSPESGAGVGFIDIARRSGNRLSHQFHILEEGLYYFILTIDIPEL